MLAPKMGLQMFANVGGEMKRKRFSVANISKVNKRVFARKPVNSTKVSGLAELADAHIEMPVCEDGKQPLKSQKPYLKDGTELVIPLNAPDKYRWWAGGQSIFDTLLELDAQDSIIDHYIGEIESPADWRRWKKIRNRDGES